MEVSWRAVRVMANYDGSLPGCGVNLFYINSRAGGPPRGVSMDTIIDNLFEGHVSCDRFQNLDVFDLWMDL